MCVCTDEGCNWERTDKWDSDAAFRDRSKSCIKGCNAHPDTMWPERKYKIKCHQDDLTYWSDSYWADRYQWKQPTPVVVNNNCTVKCVDGDKWQLEGGIDSFDIQCKATSDSGFEWVGDFKICLQVLDI